MVVQVNLQILDMVVVVHLMTPVVAELVVRALCLSDINIKTKGSRIWHIGQ